MERRFEEFNVGKFKKEEDIEKETLIEGQEKIEKIGGDEIINDAISQSKEELESSDFAIGRGISKKIENATKDFTDISEDIEKKIGGIKQELKENPLEEQLKQVSEKMKEKEYEKRIKKLIETEKDYTIKQIEAERLHHLAEIFKLKAKGAQRYIENGVSPLVKKGMTDKEIERSIFPDILLTKIRGKYWKAIYKIYGMNIKFSFEKGPKL